MEGISDHDDEDTGVDKVHTMQFFMSDAQLTALALRSEPLPSQSISLSVVS